ncbi:MAG: hypothetical protein ABW321_34190, partial [Polyangiales bacterium]
MRWAWGFLAMIVGACGAEVSPAICVIGSEGCICTVEDTCNDGLSCRESRCVNKRIGTSAHDSPDSASDEPRHNSPKQPVAGAAREPSGGADAGRAVQARTGGGGAGEAGAGAADGAAGVAGAGGGTGTADAEGGGGGGGDAAADSGGSGEAPASERPDAGVGTSPETPAAEGGSDGGRLCVEAGGDCSRAGCCGDAPCVQSVCASECHDAKECATSCCIATSGGEHVCAPADLCPPPDDQGPGGGPPPVSGNLIESHIVGEFEGWTGATIVELDNGQYWRQVGAAYVYHYAYRPAVRVVRDGAFHRMHVDGVDDSVAVELLDVLVESTIVSDFMGWRGDTLFE